MSKQNRSTTRRLQPLIPAMGLALCLAWPTRTYAETPTPLSQTVPAEPTVEQAMRLEQAGQKLEAAKIYEKMAATDPAKGMVVAGRLAKLYAELGQTNRAMSWAKTVMKQNPDPQAYLAGIHALLGQYAEARKILDAELAAAKEPRRKVTLHWQLADVYAKEGQSDKAAEQLRKASDAAKGTPDESAAKQRLEKFGANR